MHVLEIGFVEISSKSRPKSKRKFFLVVVDCWVDSRWWYCKKEQNKNLRTRHLSRLLTLYMNYLRFLLTIALTTRPFTSASQIDISVLTIRRPKSKTAYRDSVQFQVGKMCFMILITRSQNSLSTLPLPLFLAVFAALNAISCSVGCALSDFAP